MREGGVPMRESKASRPRVEVDLTDPDLYRPGFPHEVFAELRREAPVYWQSFPDDLRGGHDPGFWVLAGMTTSRPRTATPSCSCRTTVPP